MVEATRPNAAAIEILTMIIETARKERKGSPWLREKKGGGMKVVVEERMRARS